MLPSQQKKSFPSTQWNVNRIEKRWISTRRICYSFSYLKIFSLDTLFLDLKNVWCRKNVIKKSWNLHNRDETIKSDHVGGIIKTNDVAYKRDCIHSSCKWFESEYSDQTLPGWENHYQTKVLHFDPYIYIWFGSQSLPFTGTRLKKKVFKCVTPLIPWDV